MIKHKGPYELRVSRTVLERHRVKLPLSTRLWFFPTHKQSLKKPKGHFLLSTDRQLDNYSNIFYLEKRDIEK